MRGGKGDPWESNGGEKSKQPRFPLSFLPLSLPLPPSSSSLLQNGRTASWWAATYGHLEALRTLLAAGANPAAADKVRREVERRGRVAWVPAEGGRGGKRGVASLPSRGRSGECELRDSKNDPPARMRVRLGLILLESNTTFWWAMRWAKGPSDWDRSREAAPELQGVCAPLCGPLCSPAAPPASSLAASPAPLRPLPFLLPLPPAPAPAGWLHPSA